MKNGITINGVQHAIRQSSTDKLIYEACDRCSLKRKCNPATSSGTSER